jgi:hypothetical protein
VSRVREAGFTLRDAVIEELGSRAGAYKIVPPRPEGFEETVLRVAVESDSRDAVECFSRELMPFITAGPQGTTGYAEGRPRVHPLFRYWPCLIARDAVIATVDILPGVEPAKDTMRNCGEFNAAIHAATRTSPRAHADDGMSHEMRRPSHLYDIAIARSGDKGTSVNIGVIARTSEWWDFLHKWLSTDLVAAYFAPANIQSVDRFELPNLHALNFVIHGVLRRRLRTDAQGKALGQILLEMPLPDEAERQIILHES